MGGF
jgi:hypothetical protein